MSSEADELYKALQEMLAWHLSTCRDYGLSADYNVVDRAKEAVRRHARPGRTITASLADVLDGGADQRSPQPRAVSDSTKPPPS